MSVMDDEWTDNRIDDFAGRVGWFEGDVKDRFDKVDRRFDRFERNVDERFDRSQADVKARFERVDGKIDERFNRLDSKVDSTNRTIGVGIFVAVMVKIFFS
ncbi:MAG: hypothetical protein JSU06_19005 [Actinobacteria bacterium]|nr:hypothetical protein [Actinomycetota bacterium]